MQRQCPELGEMFMHVSSPPLVQHAPWTLHPLGLPAAGMLSGIIHFQPSQLINVWRSARPGIQNLQFVVAPTISQLTFGRTCRENTRK